MSDEPKPPFTDEDPTGTFAGGGPDEGATASVSQTVRNGPEERIGPYRLLQQIGEGGMGEVWLAEQSEPVKRRVAVKVIKRGMDTKSFIARFEAERQALAMMDHPAIARVFDAGETSDGRPYFAMEHIQGEAITTYCDHHKLSTTERLALFIEVCTGVQHAHQKAIIHRDIKPSNVLVAIQDGRPVPKIIDFGVAKALAQPLTEKTMYTELGQMIGTPAYMSPEQAEMTGLNVDTRTDIYSLGVLLYQLLVGALPFEPKALREAGYSEMLRVIRDEQPPRPSTRFSSLGAASTTSAENQRTEPSRLKGVLKGDLDWVVMKAIEKDRNRRYDTANGLAMDVQRFLANEPVVAGPPGTAYRAKKFIQRHRAAVIGATVVATMLLAFSVGMALLYVRSEANLERAVAAEQESSQVSDFLLELFRVSNPEVARGEEITARQLLDEGASRIETELADQPMLQARLMDTMGAAYRDLGLYEPSEKLLRGALDRAAGSESDDPIFVSNLHAGLAWLLTFLGEYDEAAIHNRRSVEILKLDGSEYEEQISHLLANYSYTMLRAGDYQLAENLAREALEIQDRLLDKDDPSRSIALFHIAWALQGQMNYDSAEDYYLQSLELRRNAFGENHPWVGWNLNNLGWLANQRGQYEKSVDWLHKALKVNRALFDRVHPEIATNSHNLGVTYRNAGHYDVATGFLQRAVDMRRELLGDDHTWVAKALDHLAKIEIEEGDGAAAEALLREALAVGDQGSGEEVGWRRLFLAEAMLAQGRAAEARIEASTAVELFESSMPEGHWWTAQAKSVLGACLAELGELDAAEGLLVENSKTIDGVKDPGDIYTVESLRRVVRFYQLVGDAAAETTYGKLLEAEQRAWQAQHDRVAVFANGAARADLALDSED